MSADDDGPEPAAVLFVKVYTMVLDDPDMMRLSFEAFGLWALMLATAKRAVTDGFVSHAHIEREALGRGSDWEAPLAELERAGAIEEASDGWLISGWGKYNKSVEEIGAVRNNRKIASASGNHTKYCVNRKMVRPDCLICHGKSVVSPGGSLSDSDRTPTELRPSSDRTPIGSLERELEGEGEGEGWNPPLVISTVHQRPQPEPERNEGEGATNGNGLSPPLKWKPQWLKVRALAAQGNLTWLDHDGLRELTAKAAHDARQALRYESTETAMFAFRDAYLANAGAASIAKHNEAIR